jgi:hypothetical protein
MLPRTPKHDTHHSACHYPKLFCELCGWSTFAIKTAHFSNLIRSQFGRRAKFTTAIAPLIDAITNVVGACSKKEMRRINTRSVITAMTNKHAFGDRAKVQVIRQTVSHPPPSRLDVTIPFDIDIALPVPTFIGRAGDNILPERHIFGSDTGFPSVRMPLEIVSWLALDVSKAGISAGRNLGRLAAATFTEFYRGFVRGILHGVTVSFQTVNKPGALMALPGAFVSSCDYTTPMHLSTNGGA